MTEHLNPSQAPSLAIRLARRGDDDALHRLAQRDGHTRPEHAELLVAEVEGEILAALPIDGGKPIADPFLPTAELVEVLKLRAGQLRDGATLRRGLRARLSRIVRPASARPASAPATPGNAALLIQRD